MQQRRQLQTPGGKVNNDLCQPRSIRGKGANFHVECRDLFVVETFWLAVVAIKCELSKLSFNNTLCKYRANGVNLQTNTNRATLRQPFKQQGVLPWANCLTALQGGNVCKRKHVATCKHFHSCKIWWFWIAKITQNFLKISPKNI